MCKEDSPFYLAINYKVHGDQHWYKCQRMCAEIIGKIMKKMAKNANLGGKKTTTQLERP